MNNKELSHYLIGIEPEAFRVAKEAFLSVEKAFTIRRGKVVGEQQLEQRLSLAITAYLSRVTDHLTSI